MFAQIPRQFGRYLHSRFQDSSRVAKQFPESSVFGHVSNRGIPPLTFARRKRYAKFPPSPAS